MSLISYLFRCTHEHVTWPIKGVQRCLDCGKRRKIVFSKDAVLASKWERDDVFYVPQKITLQIEANRSRRSLFERG